MEYWDFMHPSQFARSCPELSVGRDYHDVAPTRGIFRGGGDTRLEVEVRMEALG